MHLPQHSPFDDEASQAQVSEAFYQAYLAYMEDNQMRQLALARQVFGQAGHRTFQVIQETTRPLSCELFRQSLVDMPVEQRIAVARLIAEAQPSADQQL